MRVQISISWPNLTLPDINIGGRFEHYAESSDELPLGGLESTIVEGVVHKFWRFGDKEIFDGM